MQMPSRNLDTQIFVAKFHEPLNETKTSLEKKTSFKVKLHTPVLLVTSIAMKLFSAFKTYEFVDFVYHILYCLTNCVRQSWYNEIHINGWVIFILYFA